MLHSKRTYLWSKKVHMHSKKSNLCSCLHSNALVLTPFLIPLHFLASTGKHSCFKRYGSGFSVEIFKGSPRDPFIFELGVPNKISVIKSLFYTVMSCQPCTSQGRIAFHFLRPNIFFCVMKTLNFDLEQIFFYYYYFILERDQISLCLLLSFFPLKIRTVF